ncbi:MAG: hypothetical protein ACHQT9_03330, partial [Candidatus Saccharimonadales bacterium]
MAWTIGEIARQARDWDTAVVYLGHSAHYCAGVSSILESLDLYDGNGVHSYVEELASSQDRIIQHAERSAVVLNPDLSISMAG